MRLTESCEPSNELLDARARVEVANVMLLTAQGLNSAAQSARARAAAGAYEAKALVELQRAEKAHARALKKAQRDVASGSGGRR